LHGSKSMRPLEPIPYRDGDIALTGWLVRPNGKARVAVVLFPTIANINEPMERRAAMLAGQGYLTMIADFYGQAVDSFEASGPLAQMLRTDPDTYRARLRAAIAALRALSGDLPMAAIGFCMGGQAALEAARDGADLAAVVSFHGLLNTQAPALPGVIKGRLLVCHGDADPMVPREQVLAFWEEMDKAEADLHFHSYSGVRHGFTDPGSDARGLDAVKYNASADRQSWAAMLGLFDEVFG
jgi:dienelactone hydrolase